MATCTSVCAVCDLRHQTSASTHWCIECEDPLCSDCREHHNVLKATRHHETILISDYQSLPTVVTDINQNCVDHNEMYQLYCIKHESPICNKCVMDHGKCGEILSLDEIVRDIKTSESFVDLEQSLDDLSTNIKTVRKDRESNIESITDQKKKLSAQVCHLKKQIIQHVNKLEEAFTKELDQIQMNCCLLDRSSLSSLQEQTKEIDQMKSEIKNTKKYATNLQTFLSMRNIQVKTIEYEKYLQSSIENMNMIESTIDTKIQDILKIDRFCYINVKKRLSAIIDLKKRKVRQAQMIVPKVIKGIADVKLELKHKLNTNCYHSTGCCVTRKGDLIVTDNEINNAKVLAINAESEVEYTISLENTYRAFDVASLDESTVAVSSGYLSEKPGISIVDLTKRKKIKFIDLPAYPYGITYDGISLICCVQFKNLHVISCTDYSITIIPNTLCNWFSYISTHADKIFVTNPDTCEVICCSYSGAHVWEFGNKSVLDRPQRITVDNNGNVFVIGEDSCNVVVISPDGKQWKQILTKEDGLDRPTAIFFDKMRKQLLVTNKEQFVNVYNISYF